MLRVLAVRAAQTTYPTGDKSFSVLQAFPAVFSAEDVSPMLMLDHFGPIVSTGEKGEDNFDVPWHPHRGQDLLTCGLARARAPLQTLARAKTCPPPLPRYMVAGNGRHADSMGNRSTFDSPGVQWISAGSGIEHAEGGGNAAGVTAEGFQMWFDVPAAKKMDAPRYGTHGSAELPLLPLGAGGATARLLAGALGGAAGPFRTHASVFIADVTAPAGAPAARLDVAAEHDACLVYAFAGAGSVNGAPLARGQVARLDAAAAGGARGLALEGGAGGLRALVLTGRSLGQPIAWHGPFVMTTDAEIRAAVDEYRRGTFLRVRAPWDYKSAAAGRAFAATEAKKSDL